MKKVRDFIKSPNFKGTRDSKFFKITGDTFERKIREAGIKSGVTRKNDNGEYIQETIVHPHKLRHQLGYELAIEGKDLNFIGKILGHTSVATTQRYTQLQDKDIEKVIMERNKEKDKEII